MEHRISEVVSKKLRVIFMRSLYLILFVFFLKKEQMQKVM